MEGRSTVVDGGPVLRCRRKIAESLARFREGGQWTEGLCEGCRARWDDGCTEVGGQVLYRFQKVWIQVGKVKKAQCSVLIGME